MMAENNRKWVNKEIAAINLQREKIKRQIKHLTRAEEDFYSEQQHERELAEDLSRIIKGRYGQRLSEEHSLLYKERTSKVQSNLRQTFTQLQQEQRKLADREEWLLNQLKSSETNKDEK
ncbi:MAG TPA: hypothetical protein GX717_05475 [Clostridiaceae bacterium]|nr:hypothetical protein [Clostridiaceae bacterium]